MSGPFRGDIALEYLTAVVVATFVIVFGYAMRPVIEPASVAFLFLLLVVIAGLRLQRGPVLVLAATSALLWDYLFIKPYFSFFPLTLHDASLFAIFFAVAMAMGQLTSRLRTTEIAERERERRTAALYELVRQAGLAPDLPSGLRAATDLIERIFGVRATVTLRGDAPEPDQAREGARRLPLRTRDTELGVLWIHPPAGRTLDLNETELLDAFAVLIGTILEREELREGLRRAEIFGASQRLQRALLQSVSHELKTPLSVVGAGVDALAVQDGDAQRTRATVEEVQKALRRLHRVINNLLDMTRVESGVLQARLDWCDISELLQAAVDLAADSRGDIPIVIEAPANLPIVKVDQVLLEQALCNLLLNAASYAGTVREIVLHARVVAGLLTLSVLDDGNGIPEADLPHIFEPFRRGGDAGSGGTGLGLAIVEGFVRAHGGTVAAVNRRPHGAAFVLTIPVETLRPNVVERAS